MRYVLRTAPLSGAFFYALTEGKFHGCYYSYKQTRRRRDGVPGCRAIRPGTHSSWPVKARAEVKVAVPLAVKGADPPAWMNPNPKQR